MAVTFRSILGKISLAALIGVAACLGAGTSAVRRAEWASQDLRVRREARVPHDKIVLVKITNVTREAWKEPTAFWGPRMARIVRNLSASKVRWIGIDWQNQESTDAFLQKEQPGFKSYQADYADALAENADKLTLPIYIIRETGQESTSIPEYHLVAQALGNVGAANFGTEDDDDDGVMRRTALAYRSGDHARPTFAAAIASRLMDIDPSDEESRPALARRAGLTEPDKPFLVNFTSYHYPEIDAQELDKATVDPHLVESLRGAVVLLGMDFPDNNDQWSTPTGKMSGLEVHANILSTILDGVGISEWSPAHSFQSIGFLTALAASAALWLAPLQSTVIVTCLLGGWAAFAFQRFEIAHTMVPLGSSNLLATLGFGIALSIRAGQEAGGRRRVEAVFGKHVSKEVQQYLLNRPENLELGGKDVEGSILFVDVWGSVERGATRPANQMISELNGLFSAIVPCVTGNGGLVNRFTGDGFLAVFGAPQPDSQHAYAAVQASLEIQAAVDRYNSTYVTDPITVSCGIHSGRFACGNVGSESRAEFSVIGDVVNTAARIESANRDLNTRILVSAETYRLIEGRFATERHSTLLKGKGQTEVYSISPLGASTTRQTTIADSLNLGAGRES